MIASGKIDIGRKRTQNQDRLFISNEPIGVLQNLYIVADGMGGYNAGEVASTLAIETVCTYIKMHETLKLDTEEELMFFLKRGVAHANHIIHKVSNEDESLSGMGTTLTLCTLTKDYLYIAHVGDTRVYVIEDDQLVQVTKDHSYVQKLIDEGHISKQEADKHPKRHAITRAVGTYDRVKIDTYKYELESVKKVVLCSDGLSGMVSDEQIKKIILENDQLEETVDLLVEAANQAGGNDNIAIIIIRESEVRKEC